MKDATKRCLQLSHAGKVYDSAFWNSDEILPRVVEGVLEDWFRRCKVSAAGFDRREIMVDFFKTPIADVRHALREDGCGTF